MAGKHGTPLPDRPLVYSTAWCGDCVVARRVLDHEKVDFVEVDVDHDREAAEWVRLVNHGRRSVPTILFPDGSTLTEPSAVELRRKLADLREAAVLA